MSRRQVGGSHGRRRNQQQAERIVQPTGDPQQQAELNGVKAQLQGRFPAGHARIAPAQAEDDVQPGAAHDDAEARPQAKLVAESVGDQQDHGALAENGQPAQHDQGAQAQMILFAGADRGCDIGAV